MTWPRIQYMGKILAPAYHKLTSDQWRTWQGSELFMPPHSGILLTLLPKYAHNNWGRSSQGIAAAPNHNLILPVWRRKGSWGTFAFRDITRVSKVNKAEVCHLRSLSPNCMQRLHQSLPASHHQPRRDRRAQHLPRLPLLLRQARGACKR